MSSDLHVGSIDWASNIHKRIVAASLVQGAYNMESERRDNNTVLEKASAIGERLGFEIHDRLIDTKDDSYFATIFKYKYAHPNGDPENIPPKYAIAFRGTCIKLENIERDFISDLEFILHELHKSTRFHIALQAVERIISLPGGPENVWLVGHSLGSTIALMVGRNMVIQKEIHLKTYLFNPPFVAYSNIKPFRNIYWFGRSIVTAAASTVVHITGTREKRNQLFNRLNAWKPNLFVNKDDRISNGYISYFEQRIIMNNIGAGRIENRATQNSVISLLGEVVGEDFEPIHLIPSANLTTTKGSFFHPRKAHGIKQWWQNADLSIETESYLFNNNI